MSNVGKYLVFEGHFYDRYVVREIVGETKSTYMARPVPLSRPQDDDDVPKRLHRRSGQYVFDDREAAIAAAKAITSGMEEANAELRRVRKTLVEKHLKNREPR